MKQTRRLKRIQTNQTSPEPLGPALHHDLDGSHGNETIRSSGAQGKEP
jgi:hypothetical protein